jgi:hypothetical protein
MKSFPLVTLLVLAACSDPRLATGIAIGTDGVAVYPTLSGEFGGATVSIQPD